MRRALFVIFVTATLTSCNSRSELPPSEVLTRAARAADQLESVSFTVKTTALANLLPLTANLDLTLDGALQDRGRLAKFAYQVRLQSRASERDFSVVSTGDVVTENQQSLYLKLRSLQLTPEAFSGADMSRLFNTWWKYPLGASSQARVTSDPQVLRAQAEVVRVQKDLGIEKLKEYRAYHYLVDIDTDRFIAFMQKVAKKPITPEELERFKKQLQNYTFKGEVWIDADTFELHAIKWNIHPTGSQGVTATIDVQLSNHHQQQAIELPTESIPYSQEAFVSRLHSASGSQFSVPQFPLPLE